MLTPWPTLRVGFNAHLEKLYLYDGGALVATFDKNDNVVDMYVNGPTGRLATYYQNNTNQLYFFLNDHLGSPRAVVNSTGQTQYYAYYPFGGIIEAAGTHGTEFQFTGKERDANGNFNFDYFGARYYDSRIGSFTTVDKAGQFASGYVYGANNPISTIDPDGNWVWFLLASYGAIQGQNIAEAKGANWWESFLYSAAGFGIGAGSAQLGAYVGEVSPAFGGTAALASGSLANSVGFHVLSGGQTDISMTLPVGTWNMSGGDFDWIDFKGRPSEWLPDLMGVATLAQDLNPVFQKLGIHWLPKENKGTELKVDINNGTFVGSDGKVYQVPEDLLQKLVANPGKQYDLATGQEIPGYSGHEGKISIRYEGQGPGAGGIHVDFGSARDPHPVSLHWDPHASGGANLGTAAQHIVFDAGAWWLAKNTTGRIWGPLRVPTENFLAPWFRLAQGYYEYYPTYEQMRVLDREF